MRIHTLAQAGRPALCPSLPRLRLRCRRCSTWLQDARSRCRQGFLTSIWPGRRSKRAGGAVFLSQAFTQGLHAGKRMPLPTTPSSRPCPRWWACHMTISTPLKRFSHPRPAATSSPWHRTLRPSPSQDPYDAGAAANPARADRISLSMWWAGTAR